MLKKYFILILIFYLTLLFFIQSSSIFLIFYVFYPFFLIPFFFTAEEMKHPLSILLLIFMLAVYAFYSFSHFSLEYLLLGIGQLLFCAACFYYKHLWKIRFRKEEKERQVAFRDLRSFNHKFKSRLDSLQHLEKQVSGLLELFEIARDFSEYLSYGGIASILLKRVKPHFPFESMELIIYETKPADNTDRALRFMVTAQDIKQVEDPLTETEREIIQKIKSSKNLIQNADQWIFPLLIDSGFASFLSVNGVQQDDLAKFEVLSAFLSLQIKKIYLYDTVKELAIRDSLTGVFLRRHFLERFEEEIKRSDKYHLPLAVLMLDIDHFKRYNDEYGHLAGDAALKQVAEILIKNLRRVDIVARYGGEEFIIFIPETRRDAVLEVAERIRSSIARNVFKIYNTVTRMTVSIGVAFYDEEAALKSSSIDVRDKVFKLIQHADKALYQAKEEGRNQVVLYRGED